MFRKGVLYPIVFLSIFSSLVQAQISVQEYVVSSQSFYEKGELDNALRDINKAIEIDPKYIDAYLLRSIIKNKKGATIEALVDYDKIIELDPHNPRIEVILTNRSSLLLQKGNFEAALQDLDMAVSIDPKAAEIYIARAVVKLLKGEPDGALSDYEKSIEISPNFAAAFMGRGYFRYQANNLEGSLADYDRAIILQPKYGDLYVSRGIVYGLNNDFVSALADIKKGASISSTSVSDESRGRFSSPFKELNQFIDKNPDNARAYIIRGIFRKLEKKEEEAKNDFSKAVKINSKLKSVIGLLVKNFNDEK